jgi:predicted  nucleic acid-binding Zn-ribbon protein
MLYLTALPGPIPASLDVVRGAVIGVGTLGFILVVALIIGIGLLFRRRSGARGAPRSVAGVDINELTLQAGTALVHADDSVESAENEVGFAIAQFGTERTREFAEAVASARSDVMEAFRLKQQLDDAYPDTDQQRRDWTKRVISLADKAERVIQQQNSAFTALRRSEADSPARLAALREGIVTTRAQLRSSADTLERLTTRYSPATVAGIRGNIATAERLLGEASDRADDAESRISDTGVNRSSATSAAGTSAVGATAAAPVSTELDAAASLVHSARSSLAAIDDRAAELTQAESTLAALITDTRTDLDEAKAMRDNAPDAESGARVLSAITGVEAALASLPPVTALASAPTGAMASLGEAASVDPVGGIERLGSAVAQLDTALASARNQQQRLEHARTALVGALVAARSQIGEAKSYMAGNRAGVDARTRLAEAERQLMLAESESDPVEALDAARRSATSARDADALARYRG